MARTALSVRHHPARRRPDPGRRLHGRGQGGDCARARPLGHRLHRGRLAGRQSDRRPLLRRSARRSRTRSSSAFGMTRRAGRSAANDPGLAAILQTRARTVCMVGKTWDFHVDVALELDRTEYVDMIGDSIAHAKGRMDEVMFDAEHFFDGYKANPDYAMACLEAAEASGRALAGAVRYQRRHPAARDRAHRRRGGEEDPGRAPRHPHPQRHRECRRQHAGRRARRRAPGAGHDQRAGRALRQCQHDLADPQPGAEDGLRHRAEGRRDAAAHAPVAPARRSAQRRHQPQRRLRRHARLRPQGRAARLGGREGPAHLRACRSRDGRQPAPSSSSATRPAAPTSWRASARSGSRSIPRTRASPACSRSSRSARPRAMPTTAPTLHSSCWPGTSCTPCPTTSPCRASASWPSGGSTPAAS